MSYDERCAALAGQFLGDAVKAEVRTEADKDKLDAATADLAQDIQDIIEDFLRVRLCAKCTRIMTAKESAYEDECRECRGAA